MVQVVNSGATAKVMRLQGPPPAEWFDPDVEVNGFRLAVLMGDSPLEGAVFLGSGPEYLARQSFNLEVDSPQHVEIEAAVDGTLLDARLNGHKLPLVAPDPDGITRWKAGADLLRPGKVNVLAMHVRYSG